MPSSIETGRALAAARAKKDTTETAVAALQVREASLHEQIGFAVRDGKPFTSLESELAGVEAQLKRLVMSLAPVDTAVLEAEDLHKKTLAAEHKAQLHYLAEEVRDAAAAFEEVLSALPAAKARFVAAGNALEVLARGGGDLFAERFRTANLAADIIERRLYGRQNIEYARPVPELVEPALRLLGAR